MMTMGAPELPGDPCDDNLSTQNIQHAMPVPSDDSDNDGDSVGPYDGYQPLAMDANDASMDVEFDNDVIDNDANEEQFNDDDGENTMTGNSTVHSNSNSANDSNVPHIESVETEIVRQIWNEPRQPEQSPIELDNTRTTEILNAMANFTLPNAMVPQWAAGVPEESWKEALLQRIRERNELHISGSDLKVSNKN